MKPISLWALASAALATLAISTSSYAETKGHAVTFTLGGGYEFFSPKRDIKNTGVPFAGVGYNFTDKWAIEAILGAFNTDSKNSQDTREVSSTFFAVDGIYRFSPFHSIEPYVLAGPGITSFDPNGTDAHAAGNVNAGLGVQYFIDKPIAVRVEVRDFYTITTTKNDVMVDAALTFQWDLC